MIFSNLTTNETKQNFWQRIQRASRYVSLIALVVIIIVIISTTHLLRQEAAQSRKAQLALADLRHQTDEQSAKEAQAMGDPAKAAPLISRSNSLNSEVFTTVNELKTKHVSPATAERIRRDVAAYQQALSSSYSNLSSGKWEEAQRIDQKVTRPAYQTLAKTLTRENEALGKEADQSDRTATVGTILTMVIGIFMCGFIVWQQGRSQRIKDQQQTLRKSEERFRSLLHNASDVIVVTNSEGIMEYVTPPTRHLLVDNDTDLTGTQLSNYIHPDHRIALQDVISNPEKSKEIFEWRALGENDSWVDIECLINDLSNDPNVGGIVFTFRDVSERKYLELELRQSQKLEAVGRLAGGIAHEINTPIQFVSDNVRFLSDSFTSLSELLERYKGILTSAGQESSMATSLSAADESIGLRFILEEMPIALRESKEGLDRVAHIVRSMKAFGYPDRTQQGLANLNESLANTLVVANSEIKEIAHVVTDFGDIPSVSCYVGELNQVWLNLLVNGSHAIAAQNNGMGVLTVKTRSDDDDKNYVIVEIGDTGGGIPDSIAQHIFEPFFSTKEIGKGTGQGLAISRTTVVERHGGTITFDVEPGVGTTFSIRLPVNGVASKTGESSVLLDE